MSEQNNTSAAIRMEDKDRLAKLADQRGCTLVDFFAVLAVAWGRLTSEQQTEAIVEALHPEPTNSSPAS